MVKKILLFLLLILFIFSNVYAEKLLVKNKKGELIWVETE